jgi:hypothetical protein
MKSIFTKLGLCLLLTLFCISCAQSDSPGVEGDFPVLTGSYFGQEPPGDIPKPFAPGIINGEGGVFAITFSPDGKECFYTYRPPGSNNMILTTKEENNKWQKPHIVEFIGKPSGDNYDFNPHITPDGRQLIFGSGINNTRVLRQRYATRTESGWSDLKPLGLETEFCMFVSVANNGNLYFGGPGALFVSKFIDGQYQKPEVLSGPINEMGESSHPFIAPDESYIIFDSYTDEKNSNLFISFNDSIGNWAEPVRFGTNVNTSAHEMAAFVSRDNKYLFFSRFSEDINIYWVDAKFIEDLKPKELK